MTEIEILQKALAKAQANGYWTGEKAYVYKVGDFINVEFRPAVDAPGIYMNYETVIFSHEFAKAFFGEDKFTGVVRNRNGHLVQITRPEIKYWWEFHLQQIILEENPIKYLEAHL